MGTYGFAQFQIDVRRADEDMKRSVLEFKRRKAAEKACGQPENGRGFGKTEDQGAEDGGVGTDGEGSLRGNA